MTTITRSTIVSYSPQAMFELINDVEQYPQFLPWCSTGKVLSQNEAEMRASITVAKGPLQQSFTTHNKLSPFQKVEMRLVEGPFRFLEGVWQFEAESSTTTRVSLNIQFEFNNPFLALTLGPLIHPVAATLVQVFTKRAHQIYG